MKTKLFTLAALALAVGTAPVAAQSLQDEMVGDLAGVADKYLGLANAMAEADYTWRPGEGVRSVGEVYMHVVSANFGFPRMRGFAAPEVREAWLSGDASGLDKATAEEALRASFNHLMEFIRTVSDEQLDEEMELFGRQTNVRGYLMLVQTHLHEHLGQSIAYARTRGVVPPWSGM
jgi:uncharacterized damage-inducible protein DinB